MTIERILGTDTGKEAFGKTDRNFVALETALNNVSGAAIDITYDNTASQMTATNVQDAIDESKTQINSLEAKIGTIESQTIVENYLAAHSIPSTAKRGKLDVKLNGLSAVQSVINGNFANGTTGWLSSGATLSVNNNTLRNTGNGAFVQPLCYGAIKTVLNSKYYRRAKVRVTNALCISLRVRIFDGVNYLQQTISSPIQNQWYDSNEIVTALNTSSSAKLEILHVYADAATSNGKVMEVQNVMCIDLTAMFGAGNEPTKEQCDLMFANYFDGLQGSSNIEVKSVGKNLFDVNAFLKFPNVCSLYNDNGIDCLRIYAGVVASIPYNFKPNTQYTFKCTTRTMELGKNARILIEYTDGTSDISGLLYGDTSYSTRIVVSAVGKSIKQLGISYGVSGGYTLYRLDNFQIEEGTVATAYEPYKGTEVTYKTLDGQPITLHRLPNGVRDEITYDGKYVKRNAEYILQASDISTLSTGSVNNDIVGILKKADYKNYNVTGNILALSQSVSMSNFTSGVYADTLDAIGKHYNLDGTRIGLIVAKGAYANLAAAQSALAGTKIIYELAQPQIIDTNATPLVAEPNGHVFIIPTASPQPSAELSYPVNLGAVVDGLIEGQKQHTDLLINQNAINLDFDLRITALEP